MTDESTSHGAPAAVDRATFQAELDTLRAREKAHTREGDAIAAARRRLPMVEVDGSLALDGPDGRRPVRREQALPGLHGLGHAVVLGAPLARHAARRPQDQPDAPRRVPARRRSGLRDLLDELPR